MPNPRVLDKRRNSIRNIRKITRTMELIATARFKKAMARASSVAAYTDRITQLVLDLTRAELEGRYPLLEARPETRNARLLVLTANRGLCGGFNGNLERAGMQRWQELQEAVPRCRLDISGKHGIGAFEFHGMDADQTFTHFEDKPTFGEVEILANRYLDEYATGALDRLDIVSMKFESIARQTLSVETLLPIGSMATDTAPPPGGTAPGPFRRGMAERVSYEFLPSAESILEEIVPMSFKMKLFKCFLDSAVSEQIARMVAMKGATENADELIRYLSTQYNHARQSRITSELMDLIGGVEAVS